ncbi:MAG TPA: amino acid adenylation domain-containing protein [Candidatus Saccharimonadales bacterium]|nr:amino acid adenylation domain-containing protein [Candidatus Saccharimonadales bacterium]
MSLQDAVRLAKVEPIFPYTVFIDGEIEQSIPDRFENQVRLCGDRLAIKSEKVSFSYDSLNQTANRLARKILAVRGDGIEAVALMFEHDGGVLAAMLGVLKTGKFYLVLDPSYPSDRLAYMLADSGADLVITDTKNLPIAAQLSEGRKETVNLDHLDDSLSNENLSLNISPNALAMLLYTSGSTGQPKGVMHSHKNVLVEARNLTNAWGISRHDRWLLYTSMSFANSVRTIYGAFLNGSAVFPYDLKEKGFGELADWLLCNKITLMRSLPTTFRNFMATLPGEQTFPDIRILAVGGEPMTRADVDFFNQHFCSPCVLVHGLGPTECFMVCWNYVPHGSQMEESKLPIGYPLQDKEVLLLDESGRQVATGEVGEICVKSRYIALGYWRDLDRTKAVFRPDPLGSAARIYRTGDLGVRAQNGCLTHVGRHDFQMKIRGFRIDAAEIEAALRTIDGIKDAVVVGREDALEEVRLIAYFVPASRPVITATQIRMRLARVIPDYMIPAAFVCIAEIPQTPNGKIDRIHLPLPSGERPTLDVPFAPAGTNTEKELSQLWSEVLAIDRVGVHDDFFELGGNSLTATRIISRVLQKFQLELPIKAIFDTPTVAGMALVIEQNRTKLPHDEVMNRLLNEIEAMTEGEAERSQPGASEGTTLKHQSLMQEKSRPSDAIASVENEIAQRRAEVLCRQRDSFTALLRYVWQKSRFYRELYSAAGIRERDLNTLWPEDLPIIDRNLLMDNFDQAVTDPRLSKSDLSRWVSEVGDPGLDYLDNFIVCHSSGSSGAKGIFVCARRDWQLAASAMASRLPEPASEGTGKTKAAFYLVSHGNFSGVSGAVRMPRNVYEPCILSVLDPEEDVVNRLNEFQPHQLYGYAGSIHELSCLALMGKLRISPKRIFVGGEKLTQVMARQIEGAWAAPLYDFYSSSESKFIAYRQSDQSEMNVIDELNILEILDEANRSVEANQSGRALLTNLYNSTLPVIRYELGDYLLCGAANLVSPLKTIKDIGGRVMDALPIMLRDGSEGKVDAYALSGFYVFGLEKIQFVSLRPDHLRIIYVSAENLDAAVRHEFQRLLDRVGGANTTFEVCRASHIAADPQTGKYRLVIIQH